MDLIGSEKNLEQRLFSLCQIEIAAVYAYQWALESLDDLKTAGAMSTNDKNEMHSFIASAQDVHETHILELSSALQGIGGTPPPPDRSFAHLLIESSVLDAPAATLEDVLHALRLSEIMINRIYEDAIQTGFESGLRQIVEDFRDDENRHLDSIERRLEKLLGTGEAPAESAAPEAYL